MCHHPAVNHHSFLIQQKPDPSYSGADRRVASVCSSDLIFPVVNIDMMDLKHPITGASTASDTFISSVTCS